MSVIIIGGGGQARAAITAMENASVGWTTLQRSQAEKILQQVTQQLNTFTANPQPPA